MLEYIEDGIALFPPGDLLAHPFDCSATMVVAVITLFLIIFRTVTFAGTGLLIIIAWLLGLSIDGICST